MRRCSRLRRRRTATYASSSRRAASPSPAERKSVKAGYGGEPCSHRKLFGARSRLSLRFVGVSVLPVHEIFYTRRLVLNISFFVSFPGPWAPRTRACAGAWPSSERGPCDPFAPRELLLKLVQCYQVCLMNSGERPQAERCR